MRDVARRDGLRASKRARVTSRCCTACRRIRRPTISRISARSARSRRRSACRSGLSDHSATGESLPIAVALGASIYERHLKPENGDACLDEAVSSNSTELAAAIAAAARATARDRPRPPRTAGRGDRQPDAQPPRALRGARPRARRHREGGRHHRAAARRRAVSCALRGARRHHGVAGDRGGGGVRRRRPAIRKIGGDSWRGLTSSSPRLRAAWRSSRPSSARCARPGISGKVLVTDVNPLSPAVHMADRAFRVPYADEPDYLEEIHAVCEANGVGLIIPTIDDELPLFAARRAVFEAAGIRVAIADARTATTCNDKYATCETLRAAGVSAVETWLPETLPASPGAAALHQAARRPRRRAGVSRSAIRTNCSSSCATSRIRCCSAICDGPEFTLDLLCDFKGKPLSVVPRERVVIRSGVIDRGVTSNDPASDPARARLRAGLRLRRRRQHPVPRRRRRAGGVRNQPAVFGRHPADHRGGRRFPGDARRPRAGPPRGARDWPIHRGTVDVELRIVGISRKAGANAWNCVRGSRRRT